MSKADFVVGDTFIGIHLPDHHFRQTGAHMDSTEWRLDRAHEMLGV